MTKHTMIRRIWLSSGIRRATLCCTQNELRDILIKCEEYLMLLNHGKRDSEERVELEDWCRIVIGEIQMRQIQSITGKSW